MFKKSDRQAKPGLSDYGLSLERLETRTLLAAYTTEVLDPRNLLDAGTKGKLLGALDFTMRNLGNFISWKGVLDARININPPRSDYPSGILMAVTSGMSGNRNAAIYEMTTGVDPDPNYPDSGMTVYLAQDGSFKIWGMNPYFDPNPRTYVPANVPSGSVDIVGAVTHEVLHGLAFQDTVEFTRYLNGSSFNGPNTVATLGRSLTYAGGGHYDNQYGAGLMYKWGNYAGNRLDIGKLDLAVCKDVGLTVTSTYGLPIVDRTDSQAPRNTISGTFVNENMPAGTQVGTLNTTKGSWGYVFQMDATRTPDNQSFRIVGNRLVTTRPLDYESRNSYTIVVGNMDSAGVLTETEMTIRVGDVYEPRPPVPPNPPTPPTPPTSGPPRLFVNPSSLVRIGGTLNMGFARVSGDNSTLATLSFSFNSGTITSNITDPSVRAIVSRTSSGGTTIAITGSPAAISRNARYVSYVGNEPSVLLSLTASVNGRWSEWGLASLPLKRG